MRLEAGGRTLVARPHPSRRADARLAVGERLGRALLRMRTIDRVDSQLILTDSLSRSRGAFFAPGFCFWLRAPGNEGWRSAESRPVLARHRLGLHMTRQARHLARRLASHDAGRSPPGAPPWRFWAPVPRFLLRHFAPDPFSELLAARS